MAERAAKKLVLASGSRSRRQMLEAAGLTFTVAPADLDERAICETLSAGDTQVDPAILGGVMVRLGDRLIDGSVRGRLERLRTKLASGAL